MRKFYLFTLLFIISLFISANFTYSQTTNDLTKTSDTSAVSVVIGKIYTNAEADSLYGPVLSADTIKTDDLAKLAQNAPKFMMFNLIDGKAIILNASREVISNNSSLVTIEPTQVFRVFSTSKVLELIKQGGSDVTTIEKRADVITLTDNAITLELSAICPPHCP